VSPAMNSAKPNPEFWRSRRVLLTGHTGFMGGWLATWLGELGAETTGLSLPAPTTPSFYETVGVAQLVKREIIGDIRDGQIVAQAFDASAPEIVFHLAAQPLVRNAFAHPVETFQTNVIGTVNVLEAVRRSSATKAVLVVTSDKVYEDREWDWEFRESDRLGGKEPYGTSKACADLVCECYRRSYLSAAGIGLVTIRAGNVIGGGDWAVDRLLPDIIRAFSNGRTLMLRNPAAIRPWQFVVEPLRGYLMLAEKMISAPAGEFDGAWNFGPHRNDHKPVSWIVEHCAQYWGQAAKWAIQPDNEGLETKRLALTSVKADNQLGWQPVLDLGQALDMTMAWYKAYLDGSPVLAVTSKQIDNLCARL